MDIEINELLTFKGEPDAKTSPKGIGEKEMNALLYNKVWKFFYDCLKETIFHCDAEYREWYLEASYADCRYIFVEELWTDDESERFDGFNLISDKVRESDIEDLEGLFADVKKEALRNEYPDLVEEEIKIILTSKGQWGTRTKDVTPKNISELIEAVVNIAYGFHCDYDSVTADIVSGDDTINTSEHNLLFTGYNCEDGITQCDDGSYYDESLEQKFETYEDALRANTRQDYSGDIAEIYECYLEEISKR